jgi:uncharacterized membrane protein YoaK (UPF0700 family)
MYPALVGGAGATEVLIVLLAVAVLVGGLAAAVHVALRDDLDLARQAFLFAVVVLIPLAWIPYFLLGRERTRALVGG